MLLYLDPGTSSLIFQTIVGGLLGIGMFFSRIKIFILKYFSKKTKEEDSNNIFDEK